MSRRLTVLLAALVAALAAAGSAFADGSVQLTAEVDLPYPVALAAPQVLTGQLALGTSFSSVSDVCVRTLYGGGDALDPGDFILTDEGGFGNWNTGATTLNDTRSCAGGGLPPQDEAFWSQPASQPDFEMLSGSVSIASVVVTVTGVPSGPIGFTASGTGPGIAVSQGSDFSFGTQFTPAGDADVGPVALHARTNAPGATITLDRTSGALPLGTTATLHLAPNTPVGRWWDVVTATGGGFTRSYVAQVDVVAGPPAPPADTTPPLVTGTPDRAPNADGWYSGDVTVHWSATDPAPSSGTPSTPADTLVAGEGASLAVTSAPSCDPAGNCATGSTTVSIDRTAPAVGALAFGANPLRAGGSTTVTATAADGLSGLGGGEVFVGADPGAGNGTPLSLSGGTLSGSLALPSAPGVYTVGVRARDRAGNWSAVSTAFLVAYDPSAGFVTGGGWIVPGGASADAGDALPSLDGRSKANFGFESRYDAATSAPRGQLELTYGAGSSRFHLEGTSMTWLVVSGTSSIFEGTGSVDGQTGTYAYRVDATDGASADHLRVRVWPPGARIDVDPPLWQASGSVQGSVVIHGTP